jgi:hypothetical protein
LTVVGKFQAPFFSTTRKCKNQACREAGKPSKKFFAWGYNNIIGIRNNDENLKRLFKNSK